MSRKAGTLKADFDSGTGTVELTPEFIAETPLFRADVLRDFITELEHHYMQARSDMHAEFMAARSKLPPPPTEGGT